MGNKPSRNCEEGSPQQAQPVLTHHQSDPSTRICNNNDNNSSSNTNNNNEKIFKKEEAKLPHNYEAIIQSSDSPTDKSSPKKLLEQLRAGVFLSDQKMKYWVKGNDNINCFMVFAKGLQITWSEEMRYWVFQSIETSEGKISVASLKNVCWLDVSGKLHARYLTPGVKYEVAYLIKLTESSYGWQVPVNLKLILPNGSNKEHKENLNERPRDEWIRISVGEFEASMDNMGEIHFSLYEYGGIWKRGLVVRSVLIEPKT